MADTNPTPPGDLRQYRAELRLTAAGSPVVRVIPIRREGRSGRARQISAFVYDLAAAMERRSDEFGANWVITPDAVRGEITVELVSQHDARRADEFIEQVLREYRLL